MAQTCTRLLTHIVFSTKERKGFITDEIRHDLHAYLGGIARELKGQAIAVGGTADHVHLLVWLPADISIAAAVRILKTNSSKWIHEKWRSRRTFSWQTGYGAFSVSESNSRSVVQYISRQEQHHRRISFQDEFRAFLKKHGLACDERYLWG